MPAQSSSVPRRVLLAAEKPHMAKRQADAWKRAFPGDILTVFYVTPIGRLSLDIPRDLPLSSVPRIEEPQWAENYTFDWEMAGGRNYTVARLFHDAAEEADLIVCGTDPDHQGAFHFANLARHHGIALDSNIPWWRVNAVTDAALDASLTSLETVEHPHFQELVSYGAARRHFDYNYALNALPCFSQVLRRSGASIHVNFISKSALQLLFHLADQDEPCEEGRLITLMHRWQGTGKYPPSPLGSAISRSAIIQDLIQSKLLVSEKQEKRNKIRVTNLAREVLRHLHPGMRDPDLPARLHQWAANWPASRPDMDRYIRTVFGRQRRFS